MIDPFAVSFHESIICLNNGFFLQIAKRLTTKTLRLLENGDETNMDDRVQEALGKQDASDIGYLSSFHWSSYKNLT